ncbi:MAG: helix-turn-helix domain-containing protein, partial [Bdellovibrionota bacterium]
GKKRSLFDKMMENESFKKKYEGEKQVFELEYQLAMIMEQHGVSQKDLADKLGVDKSVVSKDLSGALKKAGMKKLQAIAKALDCDFVPLFVPKGEKDKVEKEIGSYLFGIIKRA